MSYGIRPDEKYQGRVREGSGLIQSQNGTLGYNVMLECEDGRTFYTIWITEKNREHAEKNFATLGVSLEKLRTPGYIEQLGQDIVGRAVTFGTKEEEYNGKTRVKVAWIGRQSTAVDSRKAASVCAFFGGVASAPPPATPITDDDIPF